MNARSTCMIVAALILAGFGAWTFSLGQDGVKGEQPVSPAVYKIPEPKPRDLDSGSLIEKQAYLSCQRGIDWLQRVNRPDGRFIFGYVPALRAPMTGDSYPQQIEAALALARGGRVFRDDKALAIAKQSLLTLLLETSLDPTDASVRHTSAPPALVNRLSAAGLLVLAIQELPVPEKDLQAQAGQLCEFLKRQHRSDGAFADSATELKTKQFSEAGMAHAGPALAGLMRGASATPAAWKLQAARKTRDFYAKTWDQHKKLTLVRWHAVASAEAFRSTKEQAFAESVFAINDWLCERQHQDLDPRHPMWLGGFKDWQDGKDRQEPPEIAAASCLESLVEGCRTARLAGDVRRWQRYRQAADRAVQFLATLQYTDARTQHFAEWYRPVLVGGFHRSHEEGDLRLDYTAGAVAALASYVAWTGEQPE
ncbi:MAG: hypothetical protein FJ271_07390 [Planctomycetes bacterium]|nr:hypothetical protein [Planctomycetota bacterium]